MSDTITTASGLQYEILASGEGATPGPTDTVSAHYHGTFLDGRIFDSSVDRGEPIDLPVNGVIAGWTEALLMMKEGDKWKLIVPPELGYGENGVGPIPGNTTLVFEVELIAVR
jgi:FKBP-type peptidyl-prolyl cis-trans isomerase FklB